MRTYFLISMLTMAIFYDANAKDENFIFISEYRGETIKMYWMVKTWPEGLGGFIIKKKNLTRKGDWVPVNRSAIYPENSSSKSLENVFINEDKMMAAYQKLRNQMIESKELNEVSREEFYEKLSNPGFLKILSLMFENNFSKALICGFGMVENVKNEKDKYQYGLFPVFGDQVSTDPVSDFHWNPEQEDTIKFAINYEIQERNKQIGLRVKVDMTTPNINGLRIYRLATDGAEVLLTKNRLSLGKGLANQMIGFKDNTVDPLKEQTYLVKPVTIFNTEGEGESLLYQPSVHGDDKNIRLIMKEPSYQNDKIVFKWELENPRQIGISSIYLHNNSRNKDGLLQECPSGVNEIIHSGAYQPGETYSFQLKLLTANGQDFYSAVKNYTIPKSAPANGPKLLDAKFITENGKRFAIISWEAGPEQEYDKFSLFTYFRDRPVLESDYHRMEGTSCKFELKNSSAQKIRFEIAAVDDFDNFSPKSNYIDFIAPSTFMPNLQLKNLSFSEGQIFLSWTPPAEGPIDFIGFRVYCNGEIVSSEKMLNTSSVEAQFPAPEPGDYNYSIAMVSDSGLTGDINFNARKIQIK